MSKVRAWLSGKKLYLAAAGAFITAVLAWATGEVELFPAMMGMWSSAGAAAFRAAVGKIGQ